MVCAAVAENDHGVEQSLTTNLAVLAAIKETAWCLMLRGEESYLSLFTSTLPRGEINAKNVTTNMLKYRASLNGENYLSFRRMKYEKFHVQSM